MPYYLVQEQTEDPKNPKVTPVRAKNGAKALEAVVQPRFTVKAAETEELLKLAQAGVKVVEAQ